MTVQIDRRSLIKTATLGIGALALPGAAQPLLDRRGFTHNVASGEPSATSVMLWTRYVPSNPRSNRLSWQVAEDEGFGRIVARGSTASQGSRDWCVKPVATGLRPGRWYFYRFRDNRGATSPVGRTRTLPEGPVDAFRLGVFSCSNLPFGHFNAYAHAAARRDIDLMIHLGDYLYEYPRGTYPDAQVALAGRLIEPAGEIVALADYRLRYSAYRADPDLQELHRLFPMVMMWDDHESANDSWRDGAQNHDRGEGEWAVRKAAATRACREWLPVSDANWTSYQIGNLATLFRPETRLVGRDRQLDVATALAGVAPGDRPAALARFRDTQWLDPARTLLGAEQERWLGDGLRQSTAARTRWQVLAQQVIMGARRQPPEIGAAAAALPPELRARVEIGTAAAAAGLPLSMDMWDGYPAARTRLLEASLAADANTIVLSGDSHNAWAFDIDLRGTPAAVEFAGHSVTSPGFEAYLSQVPPSVVAGMLVRANPQLKWADTSRRGYLTVELTPQRATGEFLFLETIATRSQSVAATHRMSVAHGARRLGAG